MSCLYLPFPRRIYINFAHDINLSRLTVATAPRRAHYAISIYEYSGQSRARTAGRRFAVETFGKAVMLLDAEWCGHTLALSHARSGDPALISGYLGKGDAFDKAIETFSVAYADQNDKDYDALKRAISSGKLKAVIEEPK